MIVDRCLNMLIQEFNRLDAARSDEFDAILRYMMVISENIVDEFKQYREDDKHSDSRFRFWTHVPSVERGASSVVIRWRKYQGRGRRSDPVATSAVKDYKMPISQFHGCTRAEKRAIVLAESRFSQIRRLNEHLLAINKAQNALVDVVGGRGVRERDYGQEVTKSDQSFMINEADIEQLSYFENFSEADRIAFRKKIGVSP